MNVQIAADYASMCRDAADLVIAQVAHKPDSLICFPSGESPAGVFTCLVADAKVGRVDFSACYFVGLDEWVGLGREDAGSCTNFLYENFFSPLAIEPARIQFFDAKSEDLESACKDMDDFIRARGPLDIMMVGIGMNGHIGLNEPGTEFNLYAHHAPLAPLTVSVGQKYFTQPTALSQGITLGLQYLQEARMPLLIAAGAKKAEIVAQALTGPVSTALPATIFQTLPSAYVLLDAAAAKQLP
jgi:glucosamine-6-phosphate isomerase